MISKIQMKNFKCYKECTLKLKNFNVICGPNSSGKSSINQAILLLMQNNNIRVDEFLSNGKFVHFDDFEEIKNSGTSTNKKTSILVKGKDGNESFLEIHKSNLIDGMECLVNKNNYVLKQEDTLYYLSADRIGPEDVYNKYNDKYIGIKGENAIGFLARYKDFPIDEKFAFEKDATKDYIFIKEINYWLNKIIGEKINASELERTDRSRATYLKDGESLQVRNKNTGSGLSYLISILTMGLSLAVKDIQDKPTIIIENPEIHLHPSAQVELMKFLAHMSQFCQIIIETHSDHIIQNVLEVDDGQVIKLTNFKPEYFNKKSKKILPSITLGEIKWKVFDMPTIDFHISLFSFLQQRFGEIHINKLDDRIRDTDIFKSNQKLYDTKSKRYGCNDGGLSKYETLPTYMRNVIDHPKKLKKGEPRRLKFRKTEEEFNQSLTTSIQMMINIIYEKGW